MGEATPNVQDDVASAGKHLDPLSRYPRTSAALVALMAGGLFLASILGDTESRLPTLAFEWQFGLDLIRAAIAFVIVGLVLLLIVRGWNGVWPQRFSHEGLEYAEAAAASQSQEASLREAAEILREIRDRKAT